MNVLFERLKCIPRGLLSKYHTVCNFGIFFSITALVFYTVAFIFEDKIEEKKLKVTENYWVIEYCKEWVGFCNLLDVMSFDNLTSHEYQIAIVDKSNDNHKPGEINVFRNLHRESRVLINLFNGCLRDINLPNSTILETSKIENIRENILPTLYDQSATLFDSNSMLEIDNNAKTFYEGLSNLHLLISDEINDHIFKLEKENIEHNSDLEIYNIITKNLLWICFFSQFLVYAVCQIFEIYAGRR